MQEDDLLKSLVEEYGPKRWSLIANKIGTKGSKQVRPPVALRDGALFARSARCRGPSTRNRLTWRCIPFACAIAVPEEMEELPHRRHKDRGLEQRGEAGRRTRRAAHTHCQAYCACVGVCARSQQLVNQGGGRISTHRSFNLFSSPLCRRRTRRWWRRTSIMATAGRRSPKSCPEGERVYRLTPSSFFRVGAPHRKSPFPIAAPMGDQGACKSTLLNAACMDGTMLSFSCGRARIRCLASGPCRPHSTGAIDQRDSKSLSPRASTGIA